MSTNKKRFLFSIVIFTGWVFGSYFTADVISYLFKLDLLFPYYIKWLISLSVFVLAWSIRSDSVDKTDKTILQAFYLLVFPADIIMTLDAVRAFGSNRLFFAIGFVIFIFAHLTMIVRLFLRLKLGETGKGLLTSKNILSGLVIFAISTVVMVYLLPGLSKVNIVAPSLLYNYLLTIDLCLAWLVLVNKKLPAVNAYYIFIGYLMFYISDVISAVFNSYPGTDLAILINCLIWVFYGPGMVLISLSGYNWSSKNTGLATA